jgi:hypothetical protein
MIAISAVPVIAMLPAEVPTFREIKGSDCARVPWFGHLLALPEGDQAHGAMP